jgi:general secretion pathway protein M
MAHSLPTGRAGQALALGLTSLVLAVFWLGVVTPLVDWYGERADELAQQEALAQHMEALVAALPALQAQGKAVAASGAGEAALLEGDSDNMASASLQERLQTMFAQTGVQLHSVETLAGEDAGPYRRIGLRVSFVASWPLLAALLKDIQLATPSLLVDDMQVKPALHRINTPPGSFDVTCSIFAFRSAATRSATQ